MAILLNQYIRLVWFCGDLMSKCCVVICLYKVVSKRYPRLLRLLVLVCVA